MTDRLVRICNPRLTGFGFVIRFLLNKIKITNFLQQSIFCSLCKPSKLYLDRFKKGFQIPHLNGADYISAPAQRFHIPHLIALYFFI